jgi:hypothetical protein
VSLNDKDSRQIWSSVYKDSINKASSHVDSVGGATGPQNVANMWKEHFEHLYNSLPVNNHRDNFEEKIKTYSVDKPNLLLTAVDINYALSQQKYSNMAKLQVPMDFLWRPSC